MPVRWRIWNQQGFGREFQDKLTHQTKTFDVTYSGRNVESAAEFLEQELFIQVKDRNS